MIEFTLHVLCASFWCFGFRTLFSADHIFYFVYEWAEKRLPEWVIKPTIGCVMCQSSVHGGTWFFLFMYPLFDWYFVFLFMICLCGLNTIFDRVTT